MSTTQQKIQKKHAEIDELEKHLTRSRSQLIELENREKAFDGEDKGTTQGQAEGAANRLLFISDQIKKAGFNISNIRELYELSREAEDLINNVRNELGKRVPPNRGH